MPHHVARSSPALISASILSQALQVFRICSRAARVYFQFPRALPCAFLLYNTCWTTHRAFFATGPNIARLHQWHFARPAGDQGSRDCYRRVLDSGSSARIKDEKMRSRNGHRLGYLLGLAVVEIRKIKVHKQLAASSLRMNQHRLSICPT